MPILNVPTEQTSPVDARIWEEIHRLEELEFSPQMIAEFMGSCLPVEFEVNNNRHRSSAGRAGTS